MTKKINTLDILNGSIWTGLLMFAFPLVVSNLLQVLFNMADVCVVGRFAGAIALGSVGSTTTLIAITTGIFIGLGAGINSIVAFNIATNEEKRIKKAIYTGFVVCIIFGIIVFTICFIFAKNFLIFLKTKNILLDGALLYYRVYILGIPATAIYNFSSASISATGDTKHPLYFLMIGGIVNVILNLIFVIIFNLSVLGVAIASVISQYLSMILCFGFLLKHEKIGFKICNVNLDRYMAVDILGIGIPSALQYALFSFVNLFLQIAVNSFSHTIVEGNTAAVNGEILIFQTIDAIYVAVTTFVAQNYAVRNKKRVLQSYWIGILYSGGLGLIMGALIYFFRIQFLSLFSKDSEVIYAGMTRLTLMTLTIWISPFMDCSVAASRGLSKALLPTIFIVAGAVVFRLFWIFLIFNRFRTELVLYMLFPTSWIITGVLETIYFFRVFRKEFI